MPSWQSQSKDIHCYCSGLWSQERSALITVRLLLAFHWCISKKAVASLSICCLYSCRRGDQKQWVEDTKALSSLPRASSVFPSYPFGHFSLEDPDKQQIRAFLSRAMMSLRSRRSWEILFMAVNWTSNAVPWLSRGELPTNWVYLRLPPLEETQEIALRNDEHPPSRAFLVYSLLTCS